LDALIRRDVKVPKGGGDWRGRKSGRPEKERTANDDPQPHLAMESAARSERKPDGFGRRVERRQILLNALIRRDVKVLKGSGDRKRGKLS